MKTNYKYSLEEKIAYHRQIAQACSEMIENDAYGEFTKEKILTELQYRANRIEQLEKILFRSQLRQVVGFIKKIT